MATRSKLLAHYGNVVWLNANMRTDASAKRKQALNASTQRKHKTLPLTQALTQAHNPSTKRKH